MEPDQRATLESERDFLLRSIDDLDAELAAGDISVDDHRRLSDSYTARAASIIRLLESTGVVDDDPEPTDESAPTSESLEKVGATARTGGADRAVTGRRLAVAAGLAVFVVAAGWLLARASGERGTQGLTGSIESSVRDQVLECQRIGTDLSRLTESLRCFDEVLDEDPDNVEALTYRGWYVIIAAGSASQTGNDAAAAELLATGTGFLDRAVRIDPRAPDARAFRAVARERAGDVDGACEDLAVLGEIDTPPMILELVAPVAERLDCDSAP